ncbi:MAG: hypothetical protein Kow0079_03040 [Vicingaceae bacterium]
MLRKLIILISVALVATASMAQVGLGTIKGKVLDKDSGEPLPFANVVVFQNGNQVGGATTDFDGKYTISQIPPGKYEIQATYVGYQPIKMTGVVVNSGKITFLDLKSSQGVALETFEVVEYEVPLISKDNTTTGGTVTREDIQKMPGRSASSVASTVGGVFSQDDGSGDLNVRGSRSDATTVFIDGVKVRGSQNLPQQSIEQVSVLTGGLPAEYGDATGGVISITTRGVSKEWYGSLEYVTSGAKFGDKVYGLDAFGYNLLGFSLSGPILFRKDSAGNKTDAKLGFSFSGELNSQLDPRPSFGDWKVKDDKMKEINDVPLLSNPGPAGGVVNSASFLRSEDLERTKYKLNSNSRGMNLQGKITVNTSKNTDLTFGGTFAYTDQRSYVRNNALLNSQNNPQTIETTWRAWGRFTQRFNNASSDEENASSIKNAFISFQVDYSKYLATQQDENHKDQLSHYGYVGAFYQDRVKSYETAPGFIYIIDPNTGDTTETLYGYAQNGFPVVNTTFVPDSTINPILSNYTENYFNTNPQGDLSSVNTWGAVSGNGIRFTDILNAGALVNGSNPIDVYTMWTPQGVQWNQYLLNNNSQFRVTSSGSADIKDHAIKLGFEYEQRSDRFYNIAPVGMWTVGRNLINSHLEQLDYSHYYAQPYGTYPRYDFDRFYDAQAQTHFSKKFREAYGLAPDGLDYIDFDSYGPDAWTVDMFSADELILQGLVNYAGYDHTGKKLSGNPSIDDFFTKTDDDGNFLREIPAYQPIYVAGYIQDKFAFEDLVFNIGVRVDRFDANQPVLKDPYSLFPTVTAGELEITDRPSNIGDDYVVYVQDAANPSVDNIVGYRDGDTWYNAKGEEINDPSILSATGTPQPYLQDPTRTKAFDHLGADGFKDYEPQINVMPRIAFSFPISDEAQFFAHYDVLTQRPTNGQVRMEPIDYLLMETNSNIINNPNLKPQKTIDYELGFQQKLSNHSSITLSAFYREMRNLIQVTQIVGAFPENYRTYGNLDFGTVKGLTVKYDLRRVKNVWMRAYYTLQFADGTGSSTTSSLNLINAGQANLRTIFPLSFDQRHSFNITLDYRYGEGKAYNGPKWFGKDVFANTGANLTFLAGSGTPYTKQANITGAALISGGGNGTTEGSINGSRLPWQLRVNARIDKDINLKFGKGDDENKKTATLNIYVLVQNVLNTKNILGVYRATGSTTDDGYLNAPQFQNNIQSQVDEQSFRDLYTAKLDNPFNYSLPRRIRLGMLLNF